MFWDTRRGAAGLRHAKPIEPEQDRERGAVTIEALYGWRHFDVAVGRRRLGGVEPAAAP